MASLHPPAVPPKSPSPSPGPEKNLNSRASMGPSSRSVSQGMSSPRPGGMMSGRPVSELLPGNVQTPEAEAIDQWFENLQNYEATLEEMAAASLDASFKEELSAIEQWFKVLSEAERTAALYSLLQHSTQVQIRFFITVLQQMARSDPMTALLSPAMGGSMQSQMEAKLAALNLKSPGIKSPAQRNFDNRSSLDSPAVNNFLSPNSAAVPGTPGLDAASTLAQQRARLKASAANAAHRISAPALPSPAGNDRSATWGSSLGQVAENNGPASGDAVSRPKSTEFSGSVKSPRFGLGGGAESVLSPMHGDGSWASQVNTPLIPMFSKNNNSQTVDGAAAKLNEWSNSANNRVPLMDDASKFRRVAKTSEGGRMYDEDGNPVSGVNLPSGLSQSQRRNVSAPGGGANSNNWNANRTSPALSNASGNNRFNNNEDAAAALNGLGVGGFNMNLGSPGLGGLNPMQLNLLAAQMGSMGMTPEAQLLAAQMGFGQPNWMALQAQMQAAGLNQNRPRSNMGRSTSGTVRSSNNGRSDSGKTNNEEEVDPALLNDIPQWLRSLRLHKYTPNFEGMKWQDMCIMDEAALEAKGVAALGARRKMLKTFELVRQKMGIPEPEGSAAESTPASAAQPSA